ncbi:MAG: hypothetical protein KatS3mg095_0516 [Candidatus Parcubacteria bacterium]|nr:MAG: hypothetical protein KatS3mg094_051 [Candidatus Parcubacteria bacterium]GIW66618.1 MAG: hypothetical protein KatS3mg095_0516 [Candidatus Parcubacteria bacterium]
MENEILKIILNNILPSVILFILYKFVEEFIIKPHLEYKKIIAKIDHFLKFYLNIIWNINPPTRTKPYEPLPEDWGKAKETFRNLSCELEAQYKSMILKRFLPNKKYIDTAIKDLMILSNIIGTVNDYKGAFQNKAINLEEEIRTCLRISRMIDEK